MRDTNPVVIVGGGLGGLAAATLIARAGVPVTVVERRRALGGRARTHERSGYFLTEGAHALYLGGPGARLLRELGIDPAGRTPDTGRTSVLAGGALHPAPFGRALLTTPLLTVRERAEAATLFARLATRPPAARPDVPAGTWLDALTDSPAVRSLIGAVARVATYAGPWRELPASLVARQLRIGIRPGVRYVDGGWGTMVSALRTAAERAGAQIRSASTATGVRPGEVVLDDGARLSARMVVLAGLPPEAVARLTGAALPAVGPAVEAACLDVALDRLPNPATPWVAGLEEPLLLSAYSEWARVAPAGGAVVHLVRHLSGDAEPAEHSRAALEAALDLAQPGWRDHVVHAAFLPRMTVVSAAAVPGVARPGIDVTGLPGVLVCGDWIGPEGWLADAALASAAAAARHVVAASQAWRAPVPESSVPALVP
jgi:phytoene dehydrogenase-like protein